MKKPVLIAIFILLACASCQKKNAPLFRGDYSFKTSGSITLNEIVADSAMNEIDTGNYFTLKLPNEIGQLVISDLGDGNDSVVVVMNTMGGAVVVTHAFCDDKEIFLREFTKNTLFFSVDSLTLKNEVRVQASGQMYENNTLILNMTYDGQAKTIAHDFKIHGDNIRMVATRN